MLILAIDTTSEVDSCSLYDGEQLLGRVTSKIPSNQSESILDLVDLLLKSLNIDIKKIDIIGACTGPGSYTGARIGVATALGLAKAADAKVFGVDKFRVVSHLYGKEGYLERRGKIYIKKEDSLAIYEGSLEEKVSIKELDQLTISDIIAKILNKNPLGSVKVIY